MYGPSPYCGEDQQIRQNEGEPASPPLLHCSASAEAVPLQYVFQALLRVLPRCRVLLKRGTCSVSAPISDLQLLFGDLRSEERRVGKASRSMLCACLRTAKSEERHVERR